jgi:hypothetical protein
MRIILIVVGILLLLIGEVWILQGLGVIGGSFMSGSPIWGLIGDLLVLIGAALLIWRPRSQPRR